MINLLVICGSISQAILRDCDSPLTPGVDTTVYLANKSDILSVTRDPDNPLLITEIVMVTGKKFFRYQGEKGTDNSVAPKDDLVKLKYSRRFDHSVGLLVFAVDPETKYELEQLARGVVVAITENNQKGDDGSSAFEVRGIDVGLEMESLSREPENNDTQGAFNIILKTPEKTKEPHLPATFFDTDYATTVAALEDITDDAS